MKLFLLRFNFTNEDREVRSMGETPSHNRLQSLKFNFVKELKPEKEAGSPNGIVGDEKNFVKELKPEREAGSPNGIVGDEKDETHVRFLDFAPLHPANDNT